MGGSAVFCRSTLSVYLVLEHSVRKCSSVSMIQVTVWSQVTLSLSLCVSSCHCVTHAYTSISSVKMLETEPCFLLRHSIYIDMHMYRHADKSQHLHHMGHIVGLQIK